VNDQETEKLAPCSKSGTSSQMGANRKKKTLGGSMYLYIYLPKKKEEGDLNPN
jgi:hypothetical protein